MVEFIDSGGDLVRWIGKPFAVDAFQVRSVLEGAVGQGRMLNYEIVRARKKQKDSARYSKTKQLPK